ncbi:ATP-grasp domain-containing protein [Streptomyces sp. NBC_01341]|uniref:ATP-grasp domain-containing protein n=1 Tax=Streptomyces sp. NBC_01341 TaxID=2903831 RepID=UPI002E164018|nr:ATP-grasp domain-containing protein [Streptomyces sp. NBC_01341]
MNMRVCLVSPKPPMLQRARGLKLDVVCVYTPEEFRKLPADALVAEICVVHPPRSDSRELVDVVRALHDRLPFAGVVTVQEEGVLTAALLNDALGLNGVSAETVALLTDKWRMRRHTAERGVSAVRAAVASSLEEIREFGAAQGYPLIAKPLGGSASIGIHKIDSAEAAESAYAALSGLDLKQFLLEEYLEGPEISVDALSFDGRHVPIAIADKITGTGFVEFGHAIPAQLDPSLEEDVCRTVSDFLDAVGLRNGLSHTELKLTSAGPRVIESHNRRGGDRINTMTHAVYGIDLEEAGLAWGAGQLQPLAGRPEADGGAAVVFFEAEPGRLVAIKGADEARAHSGVVEFHLNFEVGQVIPPVRWSLDRAGYVVVTAETARAAQDLAQALASQVQFVTEPAPDAEEDGAASRRRYRDLVAELNQVPHVDALT